MSLKTPSSGPGEGSTDLVARLAVAGAGALALLLPACSLDVQAPEPLLWEAELEPIGPESSLTGSAAAISRETTTEAGIEVRGGEAGDRWVWRIRRGSCQTPGPDLGPADAYPVLEAEDVSEPGTPGAEITAADQTILTTTLAADSDYHVTVAAEATPEELLSCGDLTLD